MDKDENQEEDEIREVARGNRSEGKEEEGQAIRGGGSRKEAFPLSSE